MAEKRGETVEKAIATFESELASYNAKIDAGETNFHYKFSSTVVPDL